MPRLYIQRHPASKTMNKPTAKETKTSSWEEIANEVVPAGARTGALATGANRRAGIAAPSSARIIASPPFRPGATLDETLQGRETLHARRGAHYLISRPAAAYETGYEALEERLQRVLGGAMAAAAPGATPHDLLFMDIETTGLSSSTPLFLIGTMALEAGREPQLDLFLARNLEEEAAALAAYHEKAAGKVLVTFNGKRFDWPFVEGRSRRFGLEFSEPRGHIDVLHEARRRWKPLVPNCRLQTLERYLCGRQRADDIASSRIPDTYYDWLETQNAGLLLPIVYHNAWDVLTLADLLCRLEE